MTKTCIISNRRNRMPLTLVSPGRLRTLNQTKTFLPVVLSRYPFKIWDKSLKGFNELGIQSNRHTNRDYSFMFIDATKRFSRFKNFYNLFTPIRFRFLYFLLDTSLILYKIFTKRELVYLSTKCDFFILSRNFRLPWVKKSTLF